MEDYIPGIHHLFNPHGSLFLRIVCVWIQITQGVRMGNISPCQREPTDETAISHVQGMHHTVKKLPDLYLKHANLSQGSRRTDQS